MNNSLGDSLSIEMGQQVDKMEVLQQDGTIVSHSLRSSGEGDWSSVGGCVDRPLARHALD